MSDTNPKIAIIGAGIAGLCTAVYARKSGYEAVVLDQHDSPGGLATSWRRGEYTFETCLHWLLGSKPGATLHSEWQEVFDIDELRFVNDEEYVRVEDECGGSLQIFANVERLEAELLSKAPEDAKEIRRLTADIRRFTKFELPEPSARGPRHWLTMMGALPYLPSMRRLMRETLEEYGTRFTNPLLRSFFGNGEGARLSVLPLVFSMAWMSQQNAGYPIGGSQAVIRAIVERLKFLGGDLRLAAKVEKILVDRDTAIGVHLANGKTVMADWVISAADGHATIFDMLDGRYINERIEKIYKTFESFSSYVQVSLGVARDLSGQAGFVLRQLDVPVMVDPGTWVKQMSFRFFHFDPTFSPAGKTAVTCFLPTRNFEYWLNLRQDSAKYEAEKQRLAESVIRVLEKTVHNVRYDLEVTDVSTPATVIRCTGNWQGSMEGWLLTPRTGLNQIPSTLPGLDRFMMVGQWVMPGGGLPSGLMTARSAIQAVCKHDHRAFMGGGIGMRQISGADALAKAS